MNKKTKLLISSIICLFPILLGIILWDVLPEFLIRNFAPGFYRFSSKKIVVFVYPFIFLILHFIVIFKSDWLNTPKGEKRFWYLPIASNLFYFGSFILSLIKNQ